MAHEGFIQRRRDAGRDDHAFRVDAAVGGQDIRGLSRERDFLDRSALEELRAVIGCRGCDTQTGTIRIQSRTLFSTQRRRSADRNLARDRTRVQQQRFDARITPGLLLALHACRLQMSGAPTRGCLADT